MTRARRRLLGTLAVGVLAPSACSSSGGGTASAGLDASNWSSVLAAAKGQTVNWYMYGGDDTLNTFVTGYVADQLKNDAVRLNQVKVTDTGDAVNTVLGEKQGGKTTGVAVDAIWINGENFATGVQAKIWYCGWVKDLPNAKYVDFTNPAVTSDFGVPVNGCESVWQQADSALVYNNAKLTPADVASVTSLLAWAKTHPGRFTYPAPPDFTGSMAVRTILYDTIGGPQALAGAFDEATYAPAASKLFARLNAIAPSLWRGGSTYPQSEDAVEKLYADGVIDAYFTYGPGAVADKVNKGQYPATTREAVHLGRQHRQHQQHRDPERRDAPGRGARAGQPAAGPGHAARAVQGRGHLPRHRPEQDEPADAVRVRRGAAQPVRAAAGRAAGPRAARAGQRVRDPHREGLEECRPSEIAGCRDRCASRCC